MGLPFRNGEAIHSPKLHEYAAGYGLGGIAFADHMAVVDQDLAVICRLQATTPLLRCPYSMLEQLDGLLYLPIGVDPPTPTSTCCDGSRSGWSSASVLSFTLLSSSVRWHCGVGACARSQQSHIQSAAPHLAAPSEAGPGSTGTTPGRPFAVVMLDCFHAAWLSV